MKVKCKLVLEAVLSDIESAGQTKEECKENILKKSVEELLAEGYVKDSDISSISMEVISRNAKVKVYNIVYDEDADDINTLPKTIELEIKDLPTELNEEESAIVDAVDDYLFDKFGSYIYVKTFDYDIVEEDH